MKKNGLFFFETFMIQNGKCKLNTKKNMLREKELFNLKKNQRDIYKIYTNLKSEVKYKKFNFF